MEITLNIKSCIRFKMINRSQSQVQNKHSKSPPNLNKNIYSCRLNYGSATDYLLKLKTLGLMLWVFFKAVFVCNYKTKRYVTCINSKQKTHFNKQLEYTWSVVNEWRLALADIQSDRSCPGQWDAARRRR